MAKSPLVTVASAAALLLATLNTHNSRGDDTEIYVGLPPGVESANPNILLILDTSGSMGSAVITTTEFDPTRNYAGGEGEACANEGLVFFSKDSGIPPGCDSRQHFDANKLVCAGALGTLYGEGERSITGRYTDQFGGWNTPRSRWIKNKFEDQDVAYVECEDDKGTHGATEAGPAWPRSGAAGPWVAAEPGVDAWSDWQTYTVFSANYLRWYHFERVSSSTTRLNVVKDVARNLVDSVSNVNIGLMRFDTVGGNFNPTHSNEGDRQGGPVIFPVTDIDSAGARDNLKATIDGLTATGLTPLAETLYEGLLYYRGEEVKYGVAENGLASNPDAVNSGRYRSPIEYECSRNYVVFLTDGLPNTDNDADEEINALLSQTTNLSDNVCENGTAAPIDNCLDELAEYMFKTDSASESFGTDLNGFQNIITYTVGFDIEDGSILEDTATKGGGEYFFARSAQDLSGAFTQIIAQILRVNSTFLSPAVSVNAFDRLTHRDELYFTVFQPDSRSRWPGNVKKFRIVQVTDAQGMPVDADGNGSTDVMIVDANGNPAVNASTGFFEETSRSLWTLDDFDPDGNEAGIGGLAGRLFDYDPATAHHDADSRAPYVFTYTGAPDDSGAIADLTDPANRLHEDNAFIEIDNPTGKITREMLGVPDATDEEFLDLLRWARGVDVRDEDLDNDSTDGRAMIGAPLHTRPHIVTYHVDAQANTQQDILYVMTNDGYLHMVPTEDPTGEDTPAGGPRVEGWAFMPPDLLPNIKTLYDNAEAANISYGLDGSLELWLSDTNGDDDFLDDNGQVDAGDHVYLYYGMRRGGSGYRALDVSDPWAPKHLWAIEADEDGTGPLKHLGQSWSRPRHTVILDAPEGASALEPRDVIVVGGGYDVAQDEHGARAPDSVGNAIYILDARTGEILWWAGDTPDDGDVAPDLTLPDMDYGIPADIRLIDVSSDKATDRFYASDMGGQIWRFDIANDRPGPIADRITGGRIADLQRESGTSPQPGEASNRRFYYPPDVAPIEPKLGEPFHAISIGSGYRAHPNDQTVEDRIYVIKDYDIKSPPFNDQGDIEYQTRYEGDLLDVTTRLDFSDITAADAEKLTNGWYIRLEPGGEKALASAITVDSKFLITTFVPPDPNDAGAGDACAPSEGNARLYAVSSVDGRPVANLDGQQSPDSPQLGLTDRIHNLRRRGIASEATILFPQGDDVDPIPIVNSELVPELGFDNSPKPTYWFQEGVH